MPTYPEHPDADLRRMHAALQPGVADARRYLHREIPVWLARTDDFPVLVHRTEGSAGMGVIEDAGSHAANVVALAEGVRDLVQEGLTDIAHVWPVCDLHNRGLWAVVHDGRAVWKCRADAGHVIAPIGELGMAVDSGSTAAEHRGNVPSAEGGSG